MPQWVLGRQCMRLWFTNKQTNKQIHFIVTLNNKNNTHKVSECIVNKNLHWEAWLPESCKNVWIDYNNQVHFLLLLFQHYTYSKIILQQRKAVCTVWRNYLNTDSFSIQSTACDTVAVLLQVLHVCWGLVDSGKVMHPSWHFWVSPDPVNSDAITSSVKCSASKSTKNPPPPLPPQSAHWSVILWQYQTSFSNADQRCCSKITDFHSSAQTSFRLPPLQSTRALSDLVSVIDKHYLYGAMPSVQEKTMHLLLSMQLFN